MLCLSLTYNRNRVLQLTITLQATQFLTAKIISRFQFYGIHVFFFEGKACYREIIAMF